jgi:hypothetical protein
MKQANPPRAAMWMLRHLIPGEHNDALAGDLLEEFRAGRSDAWYWRQALGAILISYRQVLSTNQEPLIFAALWSLFAPASNFVADSVASSPAILQALRQINWPASGILALVLQLLPRLAFVWAGIAAYFALKIGSRKSPGLHALLRSVARGTPVFLPAWMISFALAWPFTVNLSHPGAAHEVARLRAVAESGVSACLFRLPFFFTILFAIWIAPQPRRSARPAES